MLYSLHSISIWNFLTYLETDSSKTVNFIRPTFSASEYSSVERKILIWSYWDNDVILNLRNGK